MILYLKKLRNYPSIPFLIREMGYYRVIFARDALITIKGS
jgi:hypothetical protein